ncbi:hypothetical protein [Deinococcus kurensis]|uniref:hypothetical protein n=1 Tax=Deinococcus kurensis TaxID=2662757 RepID=UPI0012D37019|nr:hypothetical protein [Deinococcus kurensis]
MHPTLHQIFSHLHTHVQLAPTRIPLTGPDAGRYAHAYSSPTHGPLVTYTLTGTEESAPVLKRAAIQFALDEITLRGWTATAELVYPQPGQPQFRAAVHRPDEWGTWDDGYGARSATFTDPDFTTALLRALVAALDAQTGAPPLEPRVCSRESIDRLRISADCGKPRPRTKKSPAWWEQ